MYEVQQTRWDRIIRRVSGSIGPGSRVSETVSELIPVLDVERVPSELLLLGGTVLGVGSVDLLAVAAQAGKAQIFNPADSGNLITVTRALLNTTAASVIRFTNESSPRANASGTERFRDSRGGVLAEPVAQIREESSIPLIPAIGRILTRANITFVLDDDDAIAVLEPGSGFVISPQSLNVGLMVTFFWRERPVEESELSL